MTVKLKALEQYLTLDPKTAFLVRCLDLIGAGLGILFLSPVLAILTLAVKLTSPGPILYKAERIGRGGTHFKLYKFRTMVPNADRHGPAITTREDPRITPLGKFLRHTKLDELPQLLNVLKGDMSLVGPRPEDPRYVKLYTTKQRQLLGVRPGITSAASLFYKDEETLLHGDAWDSIYTDQIMPHKLTLELAYLQRRTVWRDLELILRTIAAVGKADVWINILLKMRNRHVLLLDLILLSIIPAVALSLRLDGVAWWAVHGSALLFYTAVSVVVKVVIFYLMGLYNRYWRFASVNDLVQVGLAVVVSILVLAVATLILHPILAPLQLAIYRSVPLIDGLLTGLLMTATRFGLRSLNHFMGQNKSLLGGRRVLIVGAGEAGKIAVREMRANPELSMEPVAFVDDDPAKQGSQIYGLPVLGATRLIPYIAAQHQIQRIVVAIPSTSLKRQKELSNLCEETGLVTNTLPGIYQLLAGYKTIKPVPQFDVNQLLDRAPVEIDRTEVVSYLAGATVLVTGAGGSIGSELCRQIARCAPEKIILLGHGENSIFEIGLDLRLSFPDLNTCSEIVDVRDWRRINRVVARHRPDIIFHAAAHKHVPFMEEHVEEAITNNVLGTQNVVKAAERHGVQRFVLISSDKAVNPSSIMGATKRLAEMLVMAAAHRTGRAYMAVRFGNVLGSRGSVLRIFLQQIAAGGPLTITHPDMERFFMTIPEAVQLVLQAGVLGQGGEAFVLEMGKPVRILDMAKNLIKLAGLKPERDIEIVYTGVRPGEKLSEELFMASEQYVQTRHPQLFAATQRNYLQVEALERVVLELIAVAQNAQYQDKPADIQAVLIEICYYIDKYQSPPIAKSQPAAIVHKKSTWPDAVQSPSAAASLA